MSAFLSTIVNLFGGVRRGPATGRFDPATLPEVAAAVSALSNRRFGDLNARLSELPDASRFRTVERTIGVLSRNQTDGNWLDLYETWARMTESGESLHGLGIAHVVSGWAIRGRGWGETIDKSAVEPFLQHFQAAETALARAHQASPNIAAPLAGAISCACALQAPRKKIDTLFKTLTGIDPHHYCGHREMLETLKKKWGGSDEEMFVFARTAPENAQPGKNVYALVLDAHWEARNAYGWGNDDAAADAYFKDSTVREEIVAAWRKTAGRPDYREDEDSQILYNLFAAAFYLAGDKPRTRDALEKMNGLYLDEPWETLATSQRESYDPGFIVDRITRESMGLAGG